MQQTAYFSILRYVPDEYREEFINIGLVLHSPADNFIDIKLTKNFSRVKCFDDEVNLDILKMVLEGIQEEFTLSTVAGPSLNDIKNKDLLKIKTGFYVNQLQFSPIYQIFINYLEEDLNNLFRAYVYFETKKKERISSEEVKSLMRRVMNTRGILDRIDKNPVLHNRSEEINLDFAFTSKKSNIRNFIKALSFDFDKKRTNQGINNAKVWAYNFEKLKKENEGNQLEFHTVVKTGDITKKDNRIIIETLQENSIVHYYEEIDDFVEKIINEI